jgi:hypothetical protein
VRPPAKRQRVADGIKILLDIAKESSDWLPPLKSALGRVNVLIKHYEVFVDWVVVAHNLHERSQQSKDVREGVEELIPHLKGFKQNVNTGTTDGDEGERERQSELFRYACRLLAMHTLINGLCSALEEIEKRLWVLLEKHVVAWFLDKGEDSKEVTKLIKQLRVAVIHYQVSEDHFIGWAQFTWEDRYHNKKQSMTKSLNSQ